MGFKGYKKTHQPAECTSQRAVSAEEGAGGYMSK
jgi:hypothetical protein